MSAAELHTYRRDCCDDCAITLALWEESARNDHMLTLQAEDRDDYGDDD